MNETLTRAFFMSNTSSLDHTTLLGDDTHMTFASAYLQHDVTYMLWVIVPPLLLVLGCYGNVMIVVVMRAMRASESTGCLSVYFTALAVSDLFVLWTSVLWYWPEMVLDTRLPYFHDLSCMGLMYVSYVSSMTSAWFLVAMTCQRMTSVVLPHRVGALCTVRKGKLITATILTLSCLSHLHIFFYYHVEHVEEGGYPSCVISDKNVASIFGFVSVAASSAIPFLLLLAANSVLIHGVLQSINMSGKMAGHGEARRRPSRLAKASSTATTLILTSVAFLLLTLPACVLLVYFDMIGYYEGEIDDAVVSRHLALADTVCIQLLMSNSAINFYIYVLSGRKFREEASRYLCLCYKQRKEPRLNA